MFGSTPLKSSWFNHELYAENENRHQKMPELINEQVISSVWNEKSKKKQTPAENPDSRALSMPTIMANL